MPLRTISLDGAWQFRKLGPSTGLRAADRARAWMPAVVPGCVHTDLMRASVIEDARWRMRELEQFWIGESDWEYRRAFRTPAGAQEGARLVFEGLDTVAQISLNGRLLAKTCDMHRRYAFDVTGLLRAKGDNELRILLGSPVKAARRLRRMQPKMDGFQHDRRFPFVEREPTCRNFIRKAQYQFDWDWGMCQPTSGIWRDVRLEVGGLWPDYLTARQYHHDGVVDLEATLHFTAREKGEGVPVIYLCEFVTAMDANYIRWKKGANSTTLWVRGLEPNLWWPNGLGRRPLNTLGMSLHARDEMAFDVRRRIGFRDARLVREPDKDGRGESFGFTVNGVPVFLKGANWVPASTLPSSVTPETYRFLLESCVAANFNALRVWGGGVYESDLFYDLCDELGILVWQDHMMACTCYPTAKPFVDELTAEIAHNVRRLQSHPSLLLWCGDNEGEAAVQRWFRLQPDIEYLRREYYRLMEGPARPGDAVASPVKETTEREDPSRPFWLSSPSSGIGRRGDPYDHNRGDTHFWDVWFTEAGFARYREARPRFVSEFGFQSFPHARTLAKWMLPGDLNVSSPVMEHHQRTPGGNGRVAEMALRYFRAPKDFDAFCYVTQLVEALALKTAVEHWRRSKPRCQGTLFWQLNDTWPTISCASIDGELEWKAPHYAARHFYAPVLASFNPLAPGELAPVEVWATSDLVAPVALSWRVDLVSVAGRRRKVAGGTFRLAGNASRRLATIDVKRALGLLPAGVAQPPSAEASSASALQAHPRAGVPHKPNEHFLRLVLRAGSRISENIHTFGPPKLLDLKAPSLKVKVLGAKKDGIALCVSSDVPALFVELTSANVPGVFSDNYFDLADSRVREVAFSPRSGMKPETLSRFKAGLTVRSLAGTG